MIRGRIDPRGEPTLPLSVSGLPTPIPVILDSGFSGALCLSQRHVEALDLQAVGVEWYELGDGTLVERPVYLAQVIWLGTSRTVRTIATRSDDSMIGARMFAGCVVTLDYDAGTLTVVPGPEPQRT